MQFIFHINILINLEMFYQSLEMVDFFDILYLKYFRKLVATHLDVGALQYLATVAFLSDLQPCKSDWPPAVPIQVIFDIESYIIPLTNWFVSEVQGKFCTRNNSKRQNWDALFYSESGPTIQ